MMADVAAEIRSSNLLNTKREVVSQFGQSHLWLSLIILQLELFIRKPRIYKLSQIFEGACGTGKARPIGGVEV